MQRYTCEFSDGRTRIEVTYWYNDHGQVAGEAYFLNDDYCAPIANGEFFHPYSGLHYKLHVPSRFGSRNPDAVLDVLRWTNFGKAVPEGVGS